MFHVKHSLNLNFIKLFFIYMIFQFYINFNFLRLGNDKYVSDIEVIERNRNDLLPGTSTTLSVR